MGLRFLLFQSLYVSAELFVCPGRGSDGAVGGRRGQESNHVLVKHRCELCLALKGEFRFSSLFLLLLGT